MATTTTKKKVSLSDDKKKAIIKGNATDYTVQGAPFSTPTTTTKDKTTGAISPVRSLPSPTTTPTTTPTATATPTTTTPTTTTKATYTAPSRSNYNLQSNYTPTNYTAQYQAALNNSQYQTYADQASKYAATANSIMTPAQQQALLNNNQYKSQYEEAYNALTGRDKFTYNQKDDPLYQQYEDMYTQNAKLAMTDTVGQASALTGGYANSYAATAGQAMYNQTMSQMNDKALELYQAALDTYNAEGDRLAQNYSAASDMYNTEQSNLQYQTDLAEKQREYYGDLAYNYSGLAEDSRQYDSDLGYKYAGLQQSENQYASDLAYKYAGLNEDMYQADRDFAYNQYRDAVSDEQYVAEMNANGRDANGNYTTTGMLEYLQAQGNTQATKTYLDGLVSDGEMTQDEADRLYKIYGGSTTTDESEDSPAVTSDGTVTFSIGKNEAEMYIKDAYPNIDANSVNGVGINAYVAMVKQQFGLEGDSYDSSTYASSIKKYIDSEFGDDDFVSDYLYLYFGLA